MDSRLLVDSMREEIPKCLKLLFRRVLYVCMYIALVSAPYVVDAKPKFSCQIRGAESGIHYIQ